MTKNKKIITAVKNLRNSKKSIWDSNKTTAVNELKKIFTEEELKEIFISLNYPVDKINLVKSSRPDLGDYQYNGCMKLAGIYKKNPRSIAEEIVSELEKINYLIEETKGNVNFARSKEILDESLKRLEKLGNLLK